MQIPRRSGAVLLAIGLLAFGCASSRPVLYPNETLESVGSAAADRDVEECMAAAKAGGVAGSRAGQVAGNTAGGAAVGGATGAVAGAITGSAGSSARGSPTRCSATTWTSACASAATSPSAGSDARRISPIHPQKQIFLGVLTLGGIAVLGSYVVGLAGSPEGAGAVWGGVPDGLRPLYTVNMLLAAAGFFPFTGLVFFGLDPERARVAGRPALPILIGVYAVILVASALWMPLTFRMLAEPGPALWAAIRGVLAVTGLASLALYPLLAAVEPRPRGWPWRLAQLGLFFFCFQTALLDAIVWPAYWPH